MRTFGGVKRVQVSRNHCIVEGQEWKGGEEVQNI
jgi:hypothetical protein